MKVNILPAARSDIIDGYWFYDRQDAEVGDYFVRSILSDIDMLEIYGGSHSFHWGRHRKVASKFPYSIYYQIENNEVQVYAVLDDRRDPEFNRRRLG